MNYEDTIAGARIIEVVITGLVLLLIGRVLGIPTTLSTTVVSMILGAGLVWAVHTSLKSRKPPRH